MLGTPLYKGKFEFSNFSKKGGSNFTHKKGEVDEIGGVVLKKGGITYFNTNQPFPVLSLSECLVYVFVFNYLHHFYQYYLCFTGRT